MRATRDRPDDLACLSGEMEGEGLVLDVCIDEVSDEDLGGS